MSVEMLFNESIGFEGEKLQSLDLLLNDLYSGQPDRMQQATQLLEKLESETNLWLQCAQILENSQNKNTIFFALSCIQRGIQSKWTLLTIEQKQEIKTYFENYMMKLLSQPNHQNNVHLRQTNSILVEIIKRELMSSWPTALSDLSQVCQRSQEICQNVLQILKELAQDIFQFWEVTLTSQEMFELQQKLASEFKAVLKVCHFILKAYIEQEGRINNGLIQSAFATLQQFMEYLPAHMVLGEGLVEEIIPNLINNKQCAPLSLQCLEAFFQHKEIECPPEMEDPLRNELIKVYCICIEWLQRTHPIGDCDFEGQRKKIEKEGSLGKLNTFEVYLNNLAGMLSQFFINNIDWVQNWQVENQQYVSDRLGQGVVFIVHLTKVDSEKVFKTCLDFWSQATNYLKNISQREQNQVLKLEVCQNRLAIQKAMGMGLEVLILKMPKPQEVLIIIDDDGIPKKDHLQTENTQLYTQMRETFKAWSYFQIENLINILLQKINEIKYDKPMNYNKLNAICWTAGCLEGHSQSIEFFATFIRNLFMLAKYQNHSLDNRIVVISNIMYCITCFQHIYSTNNKEFAMVIVQKLFQFIVETPSDTITEMCLNTFLKMASDHPAIFDDFKQDPNQSIIAKIVEQFPEIYNLVSVSKVHEHTYFECLARITGAQRDLETQNQLFAIFLNPYADLWGEVSRNAENPLFFEAEQPSQFVSFFFKICSLFALHCQSFKNFFDNNMSAYSLVYQSSFELINNAYNKEGTQGLNHYKVKLWATVRRSCLQLLEAIVKGLHQNDHEYFIQTHQQLLTFPLEVFLKEPEEVREPFLLIFLTACLNTFQHHMLQLFSQMVPAILEAVIPMITQDFTSHVEIRENLFYLLQSMVQNCFDVFLNIPSNIFKTLIDCVLWALKHDSPTQSVIGIKTLKQILIHIGKNQQFKETFYQAYLQGLLNDVLFLLTDGMHKNSFHQLTWLLHELIKSLSQLTIPIFNQQNNLEGFYHHCFQIMTSNFQNLGKQDHDTMIKKLIKTTQDGDVKQFEVVLRDYLNLLKIFTKDD